MWLILFRVFIVALLAHAGYVYTPVRRRARWLGALLGLMLGRCGLITLELKHAQRARPHTWWARWSAASPGCWRAPGVGRPGRARRWWASTSSTCSWSCSWSTWAS